MRNTSILGAAACAAIAAAALAGSAVRAAAVAAPPNPNVTVSVTLPAERQLFKDGAGADLARAKCQICHSSDYVFTQPPMTRAQWLAEVTKMKNVYGAPLEESQLEPIAAYLVTQNGKE
ncbi:cytochrome c [bacterium]|nr:MAG: cytochrome c [bacterium]